MTGKIRTLGFWIATNPLATRFVLMGVSLALALATGFVLNSPPGGGGNGAV